MAADKHKSKEAELYLDDQNKFKEGNPGNPLATGRPILLPKEVLELRKSMGGEFVRLLHSYLHMPEYEFLEIENKPLAVIERIIYKFVHEAKRSGDIAYIKLLGGMCGVSTETKTVSHADPEGGSMRPISIEEIKVAIMKDGFLDLVPGHVIEKEGPAWKAQSKSKKSKT